MMNAVPAEVFTKVPKQAWWRMVPAALYRGRKPL